jgi:hypothetical protein
MAGSSLESEELNNPRDRVAPTELTEKSPLKQPPNLKFDGSAEG